MKKSCITLCSFILIMLLVFTVYAAGIPTQTKDFYVNDYAGVLSESTKQLIMQNSTALQKKTGAQIVVVIVKSLEGNVLETYSLNILRTWGIGDKKLNNGVLILLSVNDKRSRIEVGFGLEGRLPDGKTGRIQDEFMLPYFKANNYDVGIKNGYLAVLQEVAAEYNLDKSLLTQTAPQSKSNNPLDNLSPLVKIIFAILIILLFLFDWIFLQGTITRLIILLAFRRGGGSGGDGNSGGGGSGGGGGSSRGW